MKDRRSEAFSGYVFLSFSNKVHIERSGAEIPLSGNAMASRGSYNTVLAWILQNSHIYGGGEYLRNTVDLFHYETKISVPFCLDLPTRRTFSVTLGNTYVECTVSLLALAEFRRACITDLIVGVYDDMTLSMAVRGGNSFHHNNPWHESEENSIYHSQPTELVAILRHH